MPRQVGKTTTTVGYMLWCALFNEEFVTGILANKLQLAQDILGKIQKAYEYLPIWLQQGIVNWNKRSIELENGSKIYAYATSAAGVRGGTYNLIFLDEFAFVPTNIADELFTSVYPTISSGKESKILISSTPNGMNHFYKMWNDAVEGNNGFTYISANWREVPGRQIKNGLISNSVFLVREGMCDAAHFLRQLVTLAGDQHHVARIGGGHRQADRRGTVHLGARRRMAPHAGDDLRDDRGWFFVARVVAVDHHLVGQALCCHAHQRPLAGVAVAAATIAWSGPSEARIKLEGAWIATTDNGARSLVTYSPTDPSGQRAIFRNQMVWPASVLASLGLDAVTDEVAEEFVAENGASKYHGIWYGLAGGNTVLIFVDDSVITRESPTRGTIQHTIAGYLASADADHDGYPDPGSTPWSGGQ